MTIQYKITTTGTQSPVVFDDLGRRIFTHPTVDYDLMTEFSLSELLNSDDIKNAISLGHITVRDENNNNLSNLESQHSHSNIDQLDLISDGTAIITHELQYNHNDIHSKQHSINSTSDHTGISGTTGNLISINSNGLPQDSGYNPSDFGGGGGMVPHDLDGTSHIGIDGIVNNFISLNTDGLPKDSGYSHLDFKKVHYQNLEVGYNKPYKTISSAVIAANTFADSTSYALIDIDPGEYIEDITITDYMILSGKQGTKIYGTLTTNINYFSHINALYIESTNSEAINKTGSGVLYSYNMSATSNWNDDSTIQSVIDISDGTIYTLGDSIYTLDETSLFTSSRVACIYNLNGSNQAQIRTKSARHIVNASAANFIIDIVHNTNTNSGNRVEVLSCIDYMTATHETAPANRISLITHDSSLGYSIFDDNIVYTYAPGNTGNVYMMPAYCYNGSNWNTVSITKTFFQWADINDTDVYLGASTHSYNVLLVNDCIFSFGTDIFPSEYTTDGSDGSLFYTITNSYGSKNVSGSGGNLAITNLAQNITGGWTFQTGSPKFEVSPVFANDVIWLARNSSDVAESVLWARASDNNTYFNYGSGGNFYIRNNSSIIQYRFTDSILDLYNKDLNNVSRVSFEQRDLEPSSLDNGDVYYDNTSNNYIARNNNISHELGVVQVVQCYNTTVTNMNNTTPTVLPLDGEDFKDNLYTHSNTTNNSRITVGADALYKITYQVNMSGASGRRQPRTRIRVNGTTYLDRSIATCYARNSTDDVGTNTCSFLWTLNSGDYIEILGDAQGTTGTFNTIANQSWLMIELKRYL